MVTHSPDLRLNTVGRAVACIEAVVGSRKLDRGGSDRDGPFLVGLVITVIQSGHEYRRVFVPANSLDKRAIVLTLNLETL